MKIVENGAIREMTESEARMDEIEWEQATRSYWQSIPYDEAVNARIRERYTESQEFSILRQRDEKPDEYAEYYAYCEECKAYVKEMKNQYT